MRIRVGSIDFMPKIKKIYRTSPEVAYERLRKRGRAEEAGVPMDFIKVRHLVTFIHPSPVSSLYIVLHINTKRNGKPMSLLIFLAAFASRFQTNYF
jgi:hypothetical protein